MVESVIMSSLLTAIVEVGGDVQHALQLSVQNTVFR